VETLGATQTDDGDTSAEAMSPGYARKVGERLRAIRRQQAHSLQSVEAASQREFKASVLGAYERGERIISVLRLQRLANFYGVPVDQLLPREGGLGPLVPRPATTGSTGTGITGIGPGITDIGTATATGAGTSRPGTSRPGTSGPGTTGAGPGTSGPGTTTDQPSAVGPTDGGGPVVIDLIRLEAVEAPEKDLISRYLRMIQLQRGDFNGRVLTIRDEDVRALALMFERDAGNMRLRMDELGIRA
jgi:hypothetical protein